MESTTGSKKIELFFDSTQPFLVCPLFSPLYCGRILNTHYQKLGDPLPLLGRSPFTSLGLWGSKPWGNNTGPRPKGGKARKTLKANMLGIHRTATAKKRKKALNNHIQGRKYFMLYVREAHCEGTHKKKTFQFELLYFLVSDTGRQVRGKKYAGSSVESYCTKRALEKDPFDAEGAPKARKRRNQPPDIIPPPRATILLWHR